MNIQLIVPKSMLRSVAGQQQNVIALVLAVILFVSVAIPVTEDAVDNSTATGTTRTILDLLTLFLALGLLVIIARGSGLI